MQMNKVVQRRARLALMWVTARGYTVLVCYQASWSTQGVFILTIPLATPMTPFIHNLGIKSASPGITLLLSLRVRLVANWVN